MKQHEIKINLPGLLKMLGSNIYAEPDVAVRELIQNAHDTCIIRQGEDPNFTQPRIDVSYDRAARTLTFSDNGMGMTEQELRDYLATIGNGFTRIQKDSLSGINAQNALLLIGQFGIGILSAFSVAERVEVYTRSCKPSATGFLWQCEGDIHYTIEETAITNSGTRLVLHLNDSSLILLDDVLLRQTIKKYADFLSVPIYLTGNRVNSGTPPWLQTRHSNAVMDFSDYVHNRYNLYPLVTFPFKETEPLPLDGLLFVPVISHALMRDFCEVDIYISHMFIKGNDKTLLPSWARFIKGVINAPTLTPTLSRDKVVRDATYETIQKMLGGIILRYLALLKENSPEMLDRVVKTYNNSIKASSLDDDNFFDHICDLVRMKTSDGDMSMTKYLHQSGGTIHYFTDRGMIALLSANKEILAIDASWGMEEQFIKKYAQRKGVKLERLEAGSGIIFQEDTVDEKWRDLERQFKLQVKKDAKSVTFDPPTVPAVLVEKTSDHFQSGSTEQELGFSSSDLRRMFAKSAQDRDRREAGDDKILHLNMSNPLMQQLRDMNRGQTFDLALRAIYYNARMFAQHYVSPENTEIVFSTNNAAFLTMINNTRALVELEMKSAALELERDELQRKQPRIELTLHRSCFFAFDPTVAENNALAKTIQAYFQKKEYGIQVITPATANWQTRLSETHFGLAEISENNPNVIYQAGLLRGQHKPVILLRRQENSSPTSTKFRVMLRQILGDHFDKSGLRGLCFDLEIDYENLSGTTKGDKIIELVTYAHRLGRTADLVKRGKQLRPRVTWETVALHVPVGILSNYQIEYGAMKKDDQITFVWLTDELDNVIPTLLQSLPKLNQANKWIG